MVVVTALIAFAVNVPLGSWRVMQRKFSLPWFVAIHASVPLILLMRYWFGIPAGNALLFIVCAVLGQVAGARLNRSRA